MVAEDDGYMVPTLAAQVMLLPGGVGLVRTYKDVVCALDFVGTVHEFSNTERPIHEDEAVPVDEERGALLAGAGGEGK
jgi:hypothetical protein